MLPDVIQKLIAHFNRLPGIGPKTAEKFVWHLLRTQKEDLDDMAEQLQTLKKSIRLCKTCYQISDQEQCLICRDPKRNSTIICVVTEPADVEAIERTHAFEGVYHVLGDVIDLVRGIGPEQIRAKELVPRVATGKVEEVIFATNPDIAGETTALTLSKMLKSHPINITRLARGLPMGSDLDYADEVTLTSAITGRKKI